MMARLPILILSALTVAGCQSLSRDGGMDAVSAFARAELGREVSAIRTQAEAAEARAKVNELIARQLSADAAVQVALLNNRGLQAAFNDLFAAEGAALEASLPPNPKFSIARLVSRPEIEIERQVVINILALATLPARREIAAVRFRAAQLRAAAGVARVAVEARRAYVDALAAQQSAALLAQAQAAAAQAAVLARRLGESGALNKLDQAREQVFFAELTGQLATARLRAQTARERLIRIMGLWGGETGFKLPAGLPPPPVRPLELMNIEREAVRRRVDLQIARLELDALAKSLGLTEVTRFINVLELTGQFDSIRERGHGERFSRSGFEVEFTIPIFDFGEARMRQAEQTYLAAVNRLADKAISVRSEARDAYRTYRASHAIARHYVNEVVPLRRIIGDEMLLRYNAMQIDVFQLLAETRQRVAAQIAAIDAIRDFWLADAEIVAALAGGGVSSAPAAVRAAPASGESQGH